VAGITLFGALLRFPTLGTQSFWDDEAATVHLTQKSFGAMLSAVADSGENTPPLYFALAWVWAKLFGSGEVGLRSLSAVLGTAIIPVAFAVGRRLGGTRVGYVVAALTAANPLLVWYSQEARSYALFALLGALSLLFFLQAKDGPTARNLAGWAVCSSLALATHYFALFLVAPELAWLLLLASRRREEATATWVAAAATTAVGLALLPLALHQRSRAGDWIAEGRAGGLARRALAVPAEFVTGLHPPAQRLLAVAGAALSLHAALLLLRPGWEAARRAATTPLAIAAAVLLVPLALALAGLDYLITRNLIVALLPLTAVVALGAGTERAGGLGIAVTVTLCALGVAIVTAVASDVRYQRDDWRGAAREIDSVPAHGPRAVLVTPNDGVSVLPVYLPGAHRLHGSPAVSELDLLSVAKRVPGEPLRAPRPPTPPPPAPGFAPFSRVEAETYTLVRYRTSPPAAVSAQMLEGQTLTGARGAALLVP
jgi:4-amino-4-deoxy-L-arabinose transferase-like glycosyltransferase